jgi:hypothetical protein
MSDFHAFQKLYLDDLNRDVKKMTRPSRDVIDLAEKIAFALGPGADRAFDFAKAIKWNCPAFAHLLEMAAHDKAMSSGRYQQRVDEMDEEQWDALRESTDEEVPYREQAGLHPDMREELEPCAWCGAERIPPVADVGNGLTPEEHAALPPIAKARCEAERVRALNKEGK